VANQSGPAAKAGMQANDVVVEFNGQPVESAQDLINKVAATPVGQAVQVTYLREVNNKLERRSASVTVAERPLRTGGGGRDASDKPATTKRIGEEARPDKPTLGIKVSELTPQLANERNLKGVRGLIVQEIDQAGIAYDAGLQRFMVIQRVNRAPVNTIDDFERIINSLKPGDPIVMHVAANNGERVAQSIVQFTFQ